MTLISYFLLFFFVLAGGSLAFNPNFHKEGILTRILTFVGAYILGILVLHLLPEVFRDVTHKHIGLWILGGFFLQLFLDQLSLGVEHGHIHNHFHSGKMRFVLQVMLGLSLHAFIEGIPLGMNIHGKETLTRNLYYSVALHKAPEAFALVLLLLSSRLTKNIVVICLFVFALMSPAGALLGMFLNNFSDKFSIVLALVCGALFHISTTIIFENESSDEHSISFKKIWAVFAGVGLSLLTLWGE